MLRQILLLVIALVTAPVALAQVSAQFPPASQDGQCFARVLSPEITQSVVEEQLVSPETFQIEVIPAVYETSTTRVMVKEATSQYRFIPAVTEMVEEQVLVQPERVERFVVPAQFETYTETVVVEPERVVWKTGSGLYGRGAAGTDSQPNAANGQIATGEVLCRVIEPAKIQTITRTRMVAPPRLEERIIPARYETIRREVVVQPARYEEEIIPAVFEDRQVRVLVRPAEERRIVVPAVYETVTREVVVGGNELTWAEVLCETNTDRFKVAEIQGALTDAGFPTLVDGAFGPRTQRAMEAFQRANDLNVGYMTVDTAFALGIDPYSTPSADIYAALGARAPADVDRA
ncbi:MAG: peptidoglycan-binding domain-containing protein [Pseudomonadota bacterium]